MRAITVNEDVNFERGQDPKRTMKIGIKPFTWDEIEDAFDNSSVERLVGAPGEVGDLYDIVEGAEGEPEEGFTKFLIKGIIDHPMSGYGDVYNQAHVDLTVERLPDGKIHTYGTKQMEVGDMEYDEEDYDHEYGERADGNMGKIVKVEYMDDTLEDLFNGLEELPQ